MEFGACVLKSAEIALYMPMYVERWGWHLTLLFKKNKNQNKIKTIFSPLRLC